tara:strand:- start:1180 stop:2055 length:876 start_codon:yes stop_codon:yes gene_type:complete
MKHIITVLIFSLLLSTNAFSKFKKNYSVGDIIEGSVKFGKKETFPLPPGKFKVGVMHKTKEFHEMMLYQVGDNGALRWAVELYATGSTQWEWWNPPDFCKRTDVFFIKKKLGNKTYACWMVNHTRNDISADKGFWKKVRDWELQQNYNAPDIWVYSKNEYSKGSRITGSAYYYNPEQDDVPKPVNLEWATNEFHIQKIKKHPKHEEFMNKYVSVSAALLDKFNQLNKIKSGTSLEADKYITQASINTGIGTTSGSGQKGDIVNQINALKDLLDSGAITKEEFERAKKKILD